jgi:hypothetical protein
MGFGRRLLPPGSRRLPGNAKRRVLTRNLSPKRSVVTNSVKTKKNASSDSNPQLDGQLTLVCKTRADKLSAVTYLLQELLKGQPQDLEWALTDPDGKVYAYITHAGAWQRKRLNASRAAELTSRGRAAFALRKQKAN